MMHNLGLCLLVSWLHTTSAAPPTFLRQGRQQPPVILKLGRRLVQMGKAPATTQKSFYTGTVRVGRSSDGPQELLVFFDTGSGQVVLDSTRCAEPPCLLHRRYQADTSTAISVNSDGHRVTPGAKQDTVSISLDTNDVEPGKVTGNFIRDTVCLGMERSLGSRAEVCAEMTLVAATNMTSEPFLDAPFDGIVGLGLEGLSVSKDHSFFGRLVAASALLPQFAIFVPPGVHDGHAEIAFGGHNEARLASPLQWVPVVRPEQGFWQVAISSISVGGQELALCKNEGCRGIVDSSSSMIAATGEVLQELEGVLSAAGHDCSLGEELLISLENGVTLALRPQDYAHRSGNKCTPQLHHLSELDRQKAGRHIIDQKAVHAGGLALHTLLLGEPVLRRYYTVYDWDAKRIGFGEAAAPGSTAGADEDAREHVEEFILMQCRSELRRV